MFAALLINFSVRVGFVLTHEGLWGVDGGAYLLSVNHVLGDEPTGNDFRRPPLAPGWLLVPFVKTLGFDMGLKTWSLLVSLAPIYPLWLLARLGLTRWQSAAVVSLAAFDLQLAEMFTAGDLPMLGFAAILLMMRALWLFRSEHGNVTLALTFILGIPWLAFTNQTSVGLAALILPGWAMLCGERATKNALPWIVAGSIAALPALPFYMQVAPGSGLLRYPGPLLTFWAWTNAAWWMFPVLASTGLLVGMRASGFVQRVGWLMLALSPLTLLFSYDESVINVLYRMRYWIQYPFYICAVWSFGRLWAARPQWHGRMLYYTTAGLAVFGILWVYQMHVSTKISRMVTPESLAALELATGDGAILTNSYSYSLYVAGITKRRSPWMQTAKPPPAYADQHRQVICVANWSPGCDVAAAIDELDAEWLLVEKTWPSWNNEINERIEGLGAEYSTVNKLTPNDHIGLIWGMPTDGWAATERAPWLTKVYEKGTVTLWHIKKLLPAKRPDFVEGEVDHDGDTA